MSLKPWMPNESAHLRAHEGWITLQKTHKRPSNFGTSFQAWIAYSLRFILAGDLTSAWKTFGGLSAQLTHMGTALNIATLENATIAMTYDQKIRFRANELSRCMEKDNEIISLLLNEDQLIKRETLRGCGFTQTFAHIPSHGKKGGQKGSDKGTKKIKGKTKEVMAARKGTKKEEETGTETTGTTTGLTANGTTGTNLRATGRKGLMRRQRNPRMKKPPLTRSKGRRRSGPFW